jgi:hypothetical protein
MSYTGIDGPKECIKTLELTCYYMLPLARYSITPSTLFDFGGCSMTEILHENAPCMETHYP